MWSTWAGDVKAAMLQAIELIQEDTLPMGIPLCGVQVPAVGLPGQNRQQPICFVALCHLLHPFSAPGPQLGAACDHILLMLLLLERFRVRSGIGEDSMSVKGCLL